MNKRKPIVSIAIASAGLLLFASIHHLSRHPAPTSGTAVPSSPKGFRPDGHSSNTALSTAIIAKEAPAGHVPDRELFGSAWPGSARSTMAAFSAWTRRYIEAPPPKTVPQCTTRVGLLPPRGAPK